ncbi:bifunctional aspartate kinase/homoserine dehydrogenase I [Emticicia aquatilis]|uniref:Bifunctional aspartate kinase/homoserine dehydrogenase I n=1 Tax=Emticicia aquatilis TaxID=1537369 RepID=A0A916YRT0_9BACT|nr:bifunctional aspartate kinase/homoserine dehydrogenase I [Emticicia aquatilis]GGD57942.1 bifunctional aspartate kinase/homoserine dehydrogenase I [Emticicia aquatilis]
MKVLKFGGTSVGTVESINQVIQILQENLNEGRKIAVVYSAMGGVTNRLIEIGKLAATSDLEYLQLLKSVEDRHFAAVRGLIDVKNQSSAIAKVKGLLNELEDLLRGVFLIKELSARTNDFIVSFGERLSTTIVTEALKNRGIDAEYLDARKVIKTDDHFGYAEVIGDLTNELIRKHFAQTNKLQCITGFIGSTIDGVTTTLGRGGSDYTGSIFGAALNATVIEIWTDVDGMLTSDPRKVKNAFTIPTITYAEAMELSHFGAKVIYPPSLTPAFQKNIPLKILNTFNHHHEGTLVSKTASTKEYSITGISSIDDIALVNVQGGGMMGVAGVSAKLFSILAANKISVILISQASSEHSICFAVDPKTAYGVKEILEEGFATEISQGLVDNISIEQNLSVIAVVGEGMKSSTGTSGKLFTVLGKNGINVVATAQGSSELNISVVIYKKDITKALNAIHETFFQVDGLTLNLYLVGATGLIGSTLLRQIQEQKEYLKQRKNLNIRLVGITNTKKMLLDEGGISLENWKEELLEKGEIANIGSFVSDVQDLNLPYSVFVDCTADKNIVQYYYSLLSSSVSIVTPNKVANSGRYEQYFMLQKAAQKHGVKFLYETNVGAGLPIINTLQGLITSGDKINKIEAVLSGTLAYIFNNFKVGDRFVDVVKEAKAKGYTEPDPRDDLSGQDVARKILILSREAGLKLEPEDVTIINLLNDACLNAPSVDAFFEELEKDNDRFEKLLQDAQANDEVLRFIATLDSDNKASIGLKTVGRSHPFFNLAGSENIISFTTERYKYNPLVVKGPGAGAEVTASGVFADIMSISSYLV